MTKKQLSENEAPDAAKVVPIQRDDDWQSELRMSDGGAVKRGSVYNVRLILEHDPNLAGVIALDEFAGQVVKLHDVPQLHITGAYWSDNDSAVVRSYLEEQYGWLFSKENLFDAIVATAQAHRVNPVKQRIEAQPWDGTPRAERYFIDYLGAEDNEYTRAVTRTWLTGAVARVYRPGCKFELVLILEGGQGIGKSSAARNLYPTYFNDSLGGLGRSKDDYQVLAGTWVVEIAELAAMKQSDTEKMKNFISAQSDTYRPSFGKFSTPHPRQCVFIGTTNQMDYLKDATGERRFFPIKCGVIPATKNVWCPDPNDIKQILAEAKHWLDNGEPLFLPANIMREAKRYQNAAKVEDPNQDAIMDYLEMLVPANWGELSMSDKQRYFETYQNGDDPAKWLSSKFLGQPMQKLTSTTTREILAVVFEPINGTPTPASKSRNAKRIRRVMDNITGWKRDGNVILYGRRARGYSRDP